MNLLDGLMLDGKSYSFKDLLGQPDEWTPRSTIRSVTASANVNPLDGLILVDATSGAVVMTLETAVGCAGRIHRFKKIDASANAMTLDGNGTETIDGALTKSTTTQYDVLTVISNGVNWLLLLGNAVAGAAGTVTSVSFTDTNDDTQTASGGPITTSGTLDIAAVDAGSDKLVGWDDSAGKKIYVTIGTGLTMTDTTITATGTGPAGDVTEIQFNDGGSPEVFGADPALTWDKTNHLLTVGTQATSGTVQAPDVSSGDGVDLLVRAGDSSAASADGGHLNLTAGDVTSATGLTTAGNVNITGGAGTNADVCGDVVISGGENSVGNGGNIILDAGDAIPTSMLAGNIIATAGDAQGTAATGGRIELNAGNATGSGNGGPVAINSGDGSGNAFFGGNIDISCGDSTTSGAGAILTLNAGDSPSGAGGAVKLVPGTGGTLGNVIIQQGANGQAVNVHALTQLVTILNTATTDSSIEIPAGSVVIGVSVRVTVAIPTATTFDYGISGATTRYGTAISVNVNTTYHGLDDGVGRYYAAATKIRFTPSATPGNQTGRVRLTIHYITITPPTS